MLAQTGLVGAALLLGLAGAVHCVAMCAAPAAGVIRLVAAPSRGARVAPAVRPALLFHAGRLLAYGAAGALVAGAVQGLGLAGERVLALRPLVVLLHAAVLAWGVTLLVTARQPAWAHGFGRALARRLQLQQSPSRHALLAGAAWIFMPCGLLYSALALASLANGPGPGGLVMLGFGVPGALALLSSRWLVGCLRSRLAARHEAGFVRVAGAVLVALSAHALWLNVGHRLAAWCAT